MTARMASSTNTRVLFSSLILSWLAYLASALSTSGSTIIVNDVYYFIPPKAVLTVTLPSGFNMKQGIVPMTAVVGSVTTATLKTFALDDDVFQAAFEKGKGFLNYL